MTCAYISLQLTHTYNRWPQAWAVPARSEHWAGSTTGKYINSCDSKSGNFSIASTKDPCDCVLITYHISGKYCRVKAYVLRTTKFGNREFV